MGDHGHSHCEGGCDHGASSAIDLGVSYSLYSKIDMDKVQCLNEAEDGSVKSVFKPWNERLNFETYLESDCDPELLINIPFTGNVKLKGFIVLGGNADSHPSRVKLFKNRPSMSFDDAAAEADQEIELQKDPDGTLEYPTKITKFSNVHHLTLYFPKNFGEETTRIYYIGLKGDFTEVNYFSLLIKRIFNFNFSFNRLIGTQF